MLVLATDHSSPHPPPPIAAARHHYCRLLLVLGLLASWVAPAAFFSSIGVMQPPNPLVQTHSTLVLNCTLTNQSLPYNSTDITFKLGGRELPNHYVRLLNRWTAQLRLPDVRRNISGIHMFCSLPESQNIAHQVIIVADPPTMPNITECIVYNWLNMTCYWEPKEQDTGLRTTQELFYTLLVHEDNPRWNSCPTDLPNENYCVWPTRDFHRDLVYALIVGASNIPDHYVFTDPVVFLHTKLKVKPDPVREAAIDENLITNTSLSLSWQPPSKRKTLLYNVTYYSEYTEVISKLVSVFTNKTHDGIVLQDLKPFTEYDIEISSIPLVDREPQGYQSDIVKLKGRTKPGVPERNPEIGPGSFYVHNSRADRNVTIYWQPVRAQHRNAKELCYIVECRGSLGDVRETRVCNYQFSVLFKLAKEQRYNVTIVAESEVGRNSSLSPSYLHIPAMTQLLPSVTDLIPVVWNNSHYRISWIPVENAVSYTLYYCKKMGGILCKEAPNWETYNGDLNETSANLAVSSSEYIFAMSVQYNTMTTTDHQEVPRHKRSTPIQSSGLFWSKCVYHHVKKLRTPEKFRPSKLQSAGSLSVDWTHPGCIDGYIQAYVIYFCLKENCQDSQTSVTASYKVYTKMWSDALEEDKEYFVWMVATSPYSKDSDPTKRIAMKVYRSGLTTGAVVGVAVSCLIVSVLIICGICYVIKYVTKKWKRLMDEVPITAPGIERIGQSNMDTEHIMYTGETLGSSRNCPPEHSGMTRIAENESNALLENNFNRRTYHRNEGSSHEQRALLMNGSAVHDPGSLTLPLETLEGLPPTHDFQMVPTSRPHSYYNNSNELRDSNAGQYDSPNSRVICPNLTILRNAENEDSLGLESEMSAPDVDEHRIENSGQSSIASYALVDPCLTPKTPPYLPALEENRDEPLALSLMSNDGAADSDSGKSSPEETDHSKLAEYSRSDENGYTLTPPETIHSLIQQNIANEESDTSPSDAPDMGYVPFPPNPSPDDISTVSNTSSNVSSLPGRIPLLNASGYVALPDEVPSHTSVILEPPNNTVSSDTVSNGAVSDASIHEQADSSPSETDSVGSEPPDLSLEAKLLHLQSDPLSDEASPCTDAQHEPEPLNNTLDNVSSTDDELANDLSSEHVNMNGQLKGNANAGKDSDTMSRDDSKAGQSGAEAFCMDYVTVPPPLNVPSEVRWSALHADQTV